MINQSVESSYLPVQAIMYQAGIEASIYTISPFKMGGNNRIYKIETSAGLFAAKQYFRHFGDQRNRLASEYAFLDYAANYAKEFVPKPYACDQDQGWALYEYIDGVHIEAGHVTSQNVDMAANFFVALNQPEAKNSKLASNLPKASESCFSIREHLQLVRERILKLREAFQSDVNQSREAQEFIEELFELWIRIEQTVTRIASEHAIFDSPLEEDQLCISPSDFGFHNALLEANGKIKFIDFEYAGIDDPAKMVGDFFSQLAVPIPASFFDSYLQQSMQCFPRAETLILRAKLLRSVYQFKWCSIALNVFLPVHLARRKFANPQLDESQVKKGQLQKAINLFQTLKQEMTNGIY